MTLLWADSFRRFPDLRYEASSLLDWSNSAGVFNGVDSYCLNLWHPSSWLEKQFTGRQTIIEGAAGQLLTSGELIQIKGGGVIHLSIQVTSAWEIAVLCGGVTLAVSSPVAIGAGEWAFLEAKATIDDVAGAVEVRNFGVPIINVSGVDTRNGGTAAEVSAIRLTRPAVQYWDDFYICDTLGTNNNDFLSTATQVPHVIDLIPTSDGSALDFSPSSGTDHFAMVDEDSSDNDGTYVSSNTVGHKDLYGLSDLPVGTGTILGIVEWLIARKDDATPRAVAQVLKSGAVESVGSNFLLDTTYRLTSRAVETDPATGVAFTEAAVNALLKGAKVTL